MKLEETANYYESVFAEYMAAFIQYKRAQGLKYTTEPRSLRAFSRYLEANGADGIGIGKELIEEWCSLRPNESKRTQGRRIIETTQFLKYLSEIGIPIHLPHKARRSQTESSFVPYIFSQEELCRFFSECGKISARTPSVMPDMLPVLLRLLLGCGLRISEALRLTHSDVELENGLIIVRMSKFNKDRIVPLSNSMLTVLRNYKAECHKLPISNKALFFVHRDGREIKSNTIYRWYRKVLWAAGISHGGRGNGPRLHDFRHTFSVNSLKSMTDKGMDIYCALPILSTYLGHASVSATGKYVRLTQDMFPEIIAKTSAITAFVIPGGDRS
jgi:site-specific recombinase XerD